MQKIRERKMLTDEQKKLIEENLNCIYAAVWKYCKTADDDISQDAVLAVCNLPNFCTYLSNPVNTYPRNISGNLTNCLNEAVVISSCNLSVTDVSDYKISYYPNPVKDIFNLSYSEDIVSISVMNTLGQLVLSQNIGSNTVQIDMSSLPSGNYFVKIVASEAIRTVKIIKL